MPTTHSCPEVSLNCSLAPGADVRAITRACLSDVALEDVAAHDGYLFVRDGIGFAGRDVATRVSADDAAALLNSMPHDDQSGFGAPGPIAIGCIPFIPGSSSSLTIPRYLVGRDTEGHTWETVVGESPSWNQVPISPTAGPVASTNSFRVHALTDEVDYLNAVRAARQAVRDGQITKAVIAREITVESDRPIDVHAVLLRLRASFGPSYRYSVDGFVGASPELLVEVDGDFIRSHPLAGTIARTGDPATDDRLASQLVASMKNQIEHRVVIDSIHETLLPYCSYLDWEPEPSVLKVANVQHLGTRLEGMLSTPRPTVVELVRLLSPTPALGGHPRDEAIELIRSVEGFDRGRYGGAVGYVDANGDGKWAVAIRGAEFGLDRRSARLVAGGGIVADSDEIDELAETQAKFQAMLSAIVRP